MSKLLIFADIFFAALLSPFIVILKVIRGIGVHKFPVCKKLFNIIGVFPIRNHYYEPQFDYRKTKLKNYKERHLIGIDWNINEQLEIISRLTYSNELMNIPDTPQHSNEFYWGNGNFESGDAEYWYQLIRCYKPKSIIEIGSGYSTLMARKAISMNHQNDSSYVCKHICIEPYEMPWLESQDVTIVREQVEMLNFDLFLTLSENDILFIDSSHIIRPEGDVLFEYLELLPRLNKGVIVHIHDIFSPNNYPNFWLKEKVLFWNEQYLLEAFLSHNDTWKIIGSLNYLHHTHYEMLKRVSPYLNKQREPGSFYIQKIK